MERAAESTELTSKELADVDFNDIKSELRENEKWKSIENNVGDENEWEETMKRWEPDIENVIKHNVDSQISDIDLSECHPKKIITYLDEEPVRMDSRCLLYECQNTRSLQAGYIWNID